MNNEETKLQRRIMLETEDVNTRVFRNNVGAAWQGSNFTIRDRRLIEGKARYVVYGLAPGSSDLVAVRSIEITPDMVGKRIAVAGFIETKVDGQTTTTEQKNFLKMGYRLGAITAVATTVEEARNALTDWKPRLWTPL